MSFDNLIAEMYTRTRALTSAHVHEVNEAYNRGYNQAKWDGYDVGKIVGGMTDEQLAEHGLVRLPTDADGVVWTGEEREFQDAQLMEPREMAGLMYYGDGKWAVIPANAPRHIGYAVGMCRHVPAEPADTPASLANELSEQANRIDGFAETCDTNSVGFDVICKLRSIVERLRKMGDAE